MAKDSTLPPNALPSQTGREPFGGVLSVFEPGSHEFVSQTMLEPQIIAHQLKIVPLVQ
jgi:hypothetical protein